MSIGQQRWVGICSLLRPHSRGAWSWQSIFARIGDGSCFPSDEDARGHGPEWQGGYRRRSRERLPPSPKLVLALLAVACVLSCSHTESPQAVFEHAQLAFVHGDLAHAQQEAEEGCSRFSDAAPQWAWKFRILEAKTRLWQGAYPQVLEILDSPSVQPESDELNVEILAIKGAALARLHQFPNATEILRQATQMCNATMQVTCGDVTAARGVIADQQGQIDTAKQIFGQSLEFARAHHDRLLESTALLNLGLASLKEEHFDEAIDWTEAAYQTSSVLGAEIVNQTALGNRGWAYYNMGDWEKALQFSVEAENRAARAGNALGQLSWIMTAGYVYAEQGDLIRAKDSYLKALGLATGTGGKADIYEALRNLALVSVESGKLEEARNYSEQAKAIAKADNNRLNELYPRLVDGLIAARSHNDTEAESVFHEIEHDQNVNASLKLRAEHELALLYEGGGRFAAADREYRTALRTFESARSSLKRNELKLPFSNNASRIYDDYVHFLVERRRPDDALRWADYSRARTLTEGLGLLAHSRGGEPPPLDSQQIARQANAAILFYWLGEKQSYLWAVTPQKTGLFTLPPRPEIETRAERYRQDVIGTQDVLQSSNPDGIWLYSTLIGPAQALLKNDAKAFIIPDGKLNSLNFETLLAGDPQSTSDSKAKLHYWIEDVTIANASSLRILGAAPAIAQKVERNLLLIGNSVAPSADYPVLPKAGAQMDSVARHFAAATRIEGAQANPVAYLNGSPEKYSYIHFVAHGTASRLSPLDSAIILSKGSSNDDSFKLYARDIVGHPLRAELVTISSCNGAGERAYSGEGLVGLAWAFLGAHAHNVIAALWEVEDSSTEQLMNNFYDELGKGASADVALREAKLAMLRGGRSNPFYWAAFQLYGQGQAAASRVRVPTEVARN